MKTDKLIDGLEIWDSAIVDNITRGRENATSTWSYGMDNKASYDANIHHPLYRSMTTYIPSDFDYTYNSHGYRSDEFDPNNVEILYAGCSFTEGEGLPLNRVWSNQLCGLINERHRLKLGYHSIGRGGLSPAGITRKIYAAIETLKLKPKMLLVLLPSIFRSEFYMANIPPNGKRAPMDFVPNYIAANLKKEEKYFANLFSQNIRISNSLTDFYKNLLLIKLLCDKNKIVLKFACWQGPVAVNDLSDDDVSRLPSKYMCQDGDIELSLLISDHMPIDLKDSYLNLGFPSEQHIKNKKYPQQIGRDYAHPGPNSHWAFANSVLEKIKPSLDILYEQNN